MYPLNLFAVIRRGWSGYLGLAGILLSICILSANAQTTQPRGVKEVAKDLDDTSAQVHELLMTPNVQIDPAARDKVAPKIIPALNHLTSVLNEWATLQPDEKDDITAAQNHFLMLRALFGDQSSIDQLNQMASSANPQESSQAKSAQLMIRWYQTAKDPVAQTAIADELESMAKAHPERDELTMQLMQLSEIGAATPALSNRLEDLIVNVMSSPQSRPAREQILQVRRLKSMENKPLVISGTQQNGKSFTTADWKGKVILVDFWATWCPPCVASLPQVEKVYAENHDKGLEVLGISNDYDADELTDFLSKNKAMTWPQLFDSAAAKQQAFNSIAAGYGITTIPTMFLIDRKGIVRSTDAGEKFEELVPKLLAE